MSTERTEQVWCTKYALTAGIEAREVEISGDYAYSLDRYRTQFAKGEWHRDRSAAITAADDMRARKIASLKRQLAKLEAMTF